MENNILNEKAIQLIPVENDTFLFFHTESLQIYPINDKRLIDFLDIYKRLGYEKSRSHYSKSKFDELYNFITKTITTAPSTNIHNDIDTQINNFNAIVLPIAGKCNLACPYCFARTKNGFNFNNFTEADIDKTIDFLVKKNPDESKPFNIIFFGGEPLLNLSIIKYTVSLFKNKYPTRKISFSITTNGTIVNDEIISLFKENNFAVLLSLDGPNNEYNMRIFKNGRSSLSKVFKNIGILLKNNVPVEIRATFISTNPYLVETYNFFEKIGLPFHIIFAYESENKSNNHLTNYDKEVLNRIEKDFDNLLKFYIKKAQRGDVLHNVTISTAINKLRFRTVEKIACGGGINYYTIMSNGDIFSCPHLMNDDAFKIGTIFTNDIAKESVIPADIDKIFECSDCWAKYLCLGGCPTQKIATGKTNLTAMNEPNCELERIKWQFYIKLFYSLSKINSKYINF